MRDLSKEEQEVADKLGEAATLQAALPSIHPSDTPEFVQAIHAAQNIVLARPATEAQDTPW